MTSIVRPQILQKTLQSFNSKIKNINLKQYMLYINIDPNALGDKRIQLQLQICRKYFNNVYYNITDKGNFKRAVLWCWNSIIKIQNNCEYIMNLQDDWLLTQQVDFNLFFSQLNQNIHSVNLRAYQTKNRYYNAHALHKIQWIKDILPKLDNITNPEVEIRRLTEKDKGFLQFPQNIVIEDLGRSWLQQNNLKRNSQDCSKFNSHIKK